MKNKITFLKILTLMVIFGSFSVNYISAQTDRMLNGTWVSIEDETNQWIYNNGDFEAFNEAVGLKGTYTVNNGILSRNLTNVFLPMEIAHDIGLESKWFTLNEFIITFRLALIKAGIQNEIIDQIINNLIDLPSANYSVDADSLVLTFVDTGKILVQIFYKK